MPLAAGMELKSGDKYIGDAIMALFPEATDDAIKGALAMLERLENYNKGRARAGYLPIRIGIGINTGIVMMGTGGGIGRME
jgi:hemerythrin